VCSISACRLIQEPINTVDCESLDVSHYSLTLSYNIQPMAYSCSPCLSFYKVYADTVGSLFGGGSIFVGAASSTSLSFLRTFYNQTTKKVYPFLTAIINVKDGVINGITWDNACVFCGPNECDEVTYNYNGVPQSKATSGQPTSGCFVTAAQCSSLAGKNGTAACDLSLYVVWTGTDSKKRAFQSSSSRFSAFPPQELQNRIKSLVPHRGGRREVEIDL
jgi:hypothetical protein